MRVLVAEDEAIIRMDVVATLAEAGLSVVARPPMGKRPSSWLSN